MISWIFECKLESPSAQLVLDWRDLRSDLLKCARRRRSCTSCPSFASWPDSLPSKGRISRSWETWVNLQDPPRKRASGNTSLVPYVSIQHLNCICCDTFLQWRQTFIYGFFYDSFFPSARCSHSTRICARLTQLKTSWNLGDFFSAPICRKWRERNKSHQRLSSWEKMRQSNRILKAIPWSGSTGVGKWETTSRS